MNTCQVGVFCGNAQRLRVANENDGGTSTPRFSKASYIGQERNAKKNASLKIRVHNEKNILQHTHESWITTMTPWLTAVLCHPDQAHGRQLPFSWSTEPWLGLGCLQISIVIQIASSKKSKIADQITIKWSCSNRCSHLHFQMVDVNWSSFFKSRKNLATPSRLQQNVAILLGFDVLGGGCNPGGKGTHCPSPQVTRWWWLRGNGSFGGVCCCANQVAALSKGCFVLVGTGRTCKSSRRKWRVFLFSSIWHWNCFRSLGAWKSWGTFFDNILKTFFQTYFQVPS